MDENCKRQQHGRRPGAARGDEAPLWHPARAIGLARALLKSGYATRREAERYVREGRVRVGSEIVTDPGRTVEPGATIFLDGRPLVRLEMRYFVLNKPLRVTSDTAEGTGRRHVADFFPPDVPGMAAAGRMDAKSQGLILMSNDTAWNTLVTTTPGLEQEFRVQVDGALTDIEISVMGAGVQLPGLGLFRPRTVRVIERMQDRTVVSITLREGKVRQLRRMLETLRHKVTVVRRIRIGDIRLGDLQVGAVRELSGPEVQSIREIAAAGRKREKRRGEKEPA